MAERLIDERVPYAQVITDLRPLLPRVPVASGDRIPLGLFDGGVVSRPALGVEMPLGGNYSGGPSFRLSFPESGLRFQLGKINGAGLRGAPSRPSRFPPTSHPHVMMGRKFAYGRALRALDTRFSADSVSCPGNEIEPALLGSSRPRRSKHTERPDGTGSDHTVHYGVMGPIACNTELEQRATRYYHGPACPLSASRIPVTELRRRWSRHCHL